MKTYKSAAERCLAEAPGSDDAITARSLLASLAAAGEAGSVQNIMAADEWFNKPKPRLPAFLEKWGTS